MSAFTNRPAKISVTVENCASNVKPKFTVAGRVLHCYRQNQSTDQTADSYRVVFNYCYGQLTSLFALEPLLKEQ